MAIIKHQTSLPGPSTGLKLLFYIIFNVFILLTDYIYVFGVAGVMGLFIFLLYPDKRFRSGKVPISLLLFATFIGNIVFHKGHVLMSLPMVDITIEGLNIAFVRTVRVFLMVVSAKLFMVSCKAEDLINTLGRCLRPLVFFRLPVRDFIEIMGLCIYALPALKRECIERFTQETIHRDATRVRDKAVVAISLAIPILMSIMDCPEKLFNDLTHKHD